MKSTVLHSHRSLFELPIVGPLRVGLSTVRV